MVLLQGGISGQSGSHLHESGFSTCTYACWLLLQLFSNLLPLIYIAFDWFEERFRSCRWKEHYKRIGVYFFKDLYEPFFALAQ